MEPFFFAHDTFFTNENVTKYDLNLFLLIFSKINIYISGDLGQSDSNVEHLCWGMAGGHDEGSSFKDSIVGRVIGGDYPGEREEEDDGQEALALLVVHAAMHMLFLPQFTCEFFEDNNDADLDADLMNDELNSSGSESIDMRPRSRGRIPPSSNAPKPIENDESEEDDEAKILAKEQEEEENIFMKQEAGLKQTRYAENGMLLLPRPTTIVWAGGIGVITNRVSIYRSCRFLISLPMRSSN